MLCKQSYKKIGINSMAVRGGRRKKEKNMMGRKGVREVAVELGQWGAPWYLTGTVKQVLSPRLSM